MECVICYEKKEASEFTTTDCDHSFCKSCLDNWMALNDSCPLCRKTIRNDNLTFDLSNDVDFSFYIIADDRTVFNMNNTVIVFYYDTVFSNHLNR